MACTSSRWLAATVLVVAVALLASSVTGYKLNVTEAKKEKCIDFTINKFDAITNLNNGSKLLFIGDKYWVLPANDYPLKETGRKVDNFYKFIDGHHQPAAPAEAAAAAAVVQQPTPQKPGVNNETFSVDAAVTVTMKAVNGKCVPTENIILYRYMSPNTSLVTIYEGDTFYTTANVEGVDIFKAVRSIDWQQRVDAMAFYENIFILFQNDLVVTVRCTNGQWKESLTKKITEIFPRAGKHAPFEAVYIEKTTQDVVVDHIAYLFKKDFFFRCPTTGNDPCEGPYNIESEYFDVSGYCWYSPPHINSMLQTMLLVGFVLVSLLLLVFAIFLLRVFLGPLKFTYFVNGKMGASANPGLSYEALKMQNDNHHHHQPLAVVGGNIEAHDPDGMVYKPTTEAV